MLLFSRVLTLTGSPRQGIPWAMDITSYVNANSGLDSTCWLATFGYPVGTVAWSTFVESQAALADATAKLVMDDGYLDRVEAAAGLITAPAQDFLREVIYGSPAEPPAVGAVVNITTATAIVDRLADALGWAVEIGQHVESVIGSPVGVLTDVFGTLGTINWIAGQPDFAASDAARGKLNADADYLGKLVATKDVFIPGSGHAGQLTRIA